MPSLKSRSTSVDLIELTRRFENRVPEVARAITDEIWTDIPSYSALGAEGRRDVEEAAARNVKSFIRALGEGHELARREIDALGEVGDRRAHQGIPLEDVLRAFRAVGRVLWDYLARDLAEASAPMESAIQVGGILMRFTDQISSSVAHHYSIAQRSIVRQQEAARREFLHDLLLGTYLSPEGMLERALAFGYDLARPHIGIVASRGGAGLDLAQDELEMSRALDGLGEKFPTLGQPMVDRRGGQTIALFAPVPGPPIQLAAVASVLAENLGQDWQIGVGGPYSGLEGCRRSYLEAREALEIGSILDHESNWYLFEDFLLYRFLRTDSALVDRFVEAVLGSIVEHDRRRRSELVKTLDAYFASDESAKEAGRRLYAHPHTVTYRLKQIERLTGRSLRDPEDKLHLHLAVKALRLSEQASPEIYVPRLSKASGAS
jgi:sugar diacid utilization regulator